MKYLIWLCRIVLGGLFIFSGVVKANDPMGLAYKMNEIFDVWGMSGLAHMSEALSIGMIAFEIIGGVAVIVGNSFRAYIAVMLLLNIFYTFLTYYIWTSGKVKECGCFGDCLKISNAETFYKDVILTSINLFLWIFRYRVFPIFKTAKYNAIIVWVAVVFAFGFQWYTLKFLPVHDCLPYRVGNNLWEKMQPGPDAQAAVYETKLTYEKNGVKKEFTEEEFNKQKIWEDPAWKFDTSTSVLIKEATGQPEIPRDFALSGLTGADSTEKVLKAKGYTFLWFVREPEKDEVKKNMDRIKNIIAKAGPMNVKFYVLCTAGPDLCKTYQEVWGMKDVTFLTLDGTVSKTAIRTNPGLMLLNDGTVEGKWSYMNYPKDIVLENGKLNCK
jgi:uncharacterized membrane protein YphA (DoxX/SURF4 family)